MWDDKISFNVYALLHAELKVNFSVKRNYDNFFFKKKKYFNFFDIII